MPMHQRLSPHKRGYGKRWQAFRLVFLRQNPLCAYCLRFGKTTPATVVDHIIPHRGDMALFWREGNHMSLCKHCHDSTKQAEERGSADLGCDASGLPLAKAHHWNA